MSLQQTLHFGLMRNLKLRQRFHALLVFSCRLHYSERMLSISPFHLVHNGKRGLLRRVQALALDTLFWRQWLNSRAQLQLTYQWEMITSAQSLYLIGLLPRFLRLSR